jgi:DNA-directed RNA polymerase subunit beta'
LDVLQYFISTNGARKGLVDTALKTANSGYLTRRLVDVAQDVVVTEDDCKTEDGIMIAAVIEGGDELVPLGERILGRVLADDVYAYDDQEVVLLARNTIISEDEVSLLERHSIDQVQVRSVMTCESRHGVCALCYGRDLSRGHLVNQGEAVGVVAAQSIGEPGTQLTMRTFHIGGAASKGVVENSIQVKHDGIVAFHNIRTVENFKGNLVVISRSGYVSVRNDKGRECERYKAIYGAVFSVKDGARVVRGDVIANWDPHTHPIVAEVEGVVEMVDFVDGATVVQQTDEMTGDRKSTRLNSSHKH